MQIDISSAIIAAGDLVDYGRINEKAISRGGYNYNRSRDRFVKITVEDNGIGFNEAHTGKIFEIVQRLHNASMSERTGIGSAICKKIVDNHHGSICAESKFREGAVVNIILPISQKNFVME